MGFYFQDWLDMLMDYNKEYLIHFIGCCECDLPSAEPGEHSWCEPTGLCNHDGCRCPGAKLGRWAISNHGNTMLTVSKLSSRTITQVQYLMRGIFQLRSRYKCLGFKRTPVTNPSKLTHLPECRTIYIYMRRRIGSALVQIMACRLFGA